VRDLDNASFSNRDELVLFVLRQAELEEDPALNFQIYQKLVFSPFRCISVVDGRVMRGCVGITEEATRILTETRIKRQMLHLVKAARGGHSEAQFRLSRAIRESELPSTDADFRDDFSKGELWWLERAAESGSEDARQRLRRIEEEIKRVQQVAQRDTNAAEEVRSRELEQANAIAEQERTNPNCSAFRFSGIAVGGSPRNLSVARDYPDLAELLKQNPLLCTANALVQAYSCKGVGFFTEQKAIVLSWSKDWVYALTSLELTYGAQNSVLYINRKDARCMDKIIPSTLPSENRDRFILSKTRYR